MIVPLLPACTPLDSASCAIQAVGRSARLLSCPVGGNQPTTGRCVEERCAPCGDPVVVHAHGNRRRRFAVPQDSPNASGQLLDHDDPTPQSPAAGARRAEQHDVVCCPPPTRCRAPVAKSPFLAVPAAGEERRTHRRQAGSIGPEAWRREEDDDAYASTGTSSADTPIRRRLAEAKTAMAKYEATPPSPSVHKNLPKPAPTKRPPPCWRWRTLIPTVGRADEARAKYQQVSKNSRTRRFEKGEEAVRMWNKTTNPAR